MKLLLHIGYPKTATTTLQKLLFNKLYEENQINYIFKNNENKELFDFIVLGKESKKSFSENLLNVISDETLILSSTNIESVCKRVLSFTKDIKVVVSIRNHSDLIFSWYVQILPSVNKTPEFFLEEFLYKGRNQEFFSSFYFFNQIEKYAKIVGRENISIVFYEDLLNKKEEYYKVWADLLSIDIEKVKKSLNEKLNEKKKKNNKYIRDFNLRDILSNVVYKSGLFYLYKNYLRDFNLIYNLFRKVYKNSAKIKFKEIEFQKFDSEIKERITNHYKDDTLMLAEKYNLDLEKLKKYNYI